MTSQFKSKTYFWIFQLPWWKYILIFRSCFYEISSEKKENRCEQDCMSWRCMRAAGMQKSVLWRNVKRIKWTSNKSPSASFPGPAHHKNTNKSEAMVKGDSVGGSNKQQTKDQIHWWWRCTVGLLGFCCLLVNFRGSDMLRCPWSSFNVISYRMCTFKEDIRQRN